MTDAYSIPKELVLNSDAGPKYFVIGGSEQWLMRFNLHDGTMEIGPGLKPDEAGRQAVHVMRDVWGDMFKAALAAEREECAKVADEFGQRYSGLEATVGNHIAAAIRRRT